MRVREKKRVVLALLLIVPLLFLIGGISSYVNGSEGRKIPKVGPVRINPHPASLEGKTVLLRWNGKYNGDKFLSRVGELIAQHVKKVKVIKMWEMDKGTAAVSKNGEVRS